MEDKLLELKNMINNVIVTNGKGQITGQDLNEVLNEMSDVLSAINSSEKKEENNSLIADAMEEIKEVIDYGDGEIYEETIGINMTSEKAKEHNKKIYEKIKNAPFIPVIDMTSVIKMKMEGLPEEELPEEELPEEEITEPEIEQYLMTSITLVGLNLSTFLLEMIGPDAEIPSFFEDYIDTVIYMLISVDMMSGGGGMFLLFNDGKMVAMEGLI